MGAVTYYEKGSWKFCCYQCGRTDIKASQALRQWQGFYVCPDCFEMRNAQELIRPVPDKQVPPWVQRCGGVECGEQQGNTRVLDSMFLDELSLD